MDKTYQYYMLYRPPMPGAMPRDGLYTITCLDPRDEIQAIGRGAWALLTYKRRLTDREVNQYELTPVGETGGEQDA